MTAGGGSKGRRHYHHGALREALLDAAERELAEKGENGFSLRSVAKRAGVSHAAPAHHFRDVGALLNGLAQRGFERLTLAMKTEQENIGQAGPHARLAAAGVGYVRFAVANPDLFQLMFGGRLARPPPAGLVKAADAALSVLLNGVARLRGKDALTAESGWRDVTALWSAVHGYAHLLVGGKMVWLTDRSVDAQRPVIEDLVARIIAD